MFVFADQPTFHSGGFASGGSAINGAIPSRFFSSSCINPFPFCFFPFLLSPFVVLGVFSQTLFKYFVYFLHLPILSPQYYLRTHYCSIIFGEHAVLLEASMLLPCAVPQQREMGGPAQVSLAAGRQEVEGVIVRDEWVLEKRVSRK